MIRERRDNKGRLLMTNESQIKNGSYCYRYFDVMTGVRKSITCWRLLPEDPPIPGRDEPDSLRELEMRINRANGKKPRKLPEHKYTMNDFWEKYLSTKCNIAESTLVSYIYLYNTHIREDLGHRLVTMILSSDIRQFYVKKVSEGLGLSSIQNIANIVEPVLEIAASDGFIDRNPAKGVVNDFRRRRDWEAKHVEALTEKEQEALVDFVASSYEYRGALPILTVFLGTGMRAGELCGLTWNDVDFERNVISVNKTLNYGTSLSGSCRFYISFPKTKKGVRDIPMFTDVRETLQKMYDRREDFNPDFQPVIDGYTDFVFRDLRGAVYKLEQLNRLWKKIIRDYNEQETRTAEEENRKPVLLPHFSCHVLRHTFCTRLCEQKVNIKSVQKWMGHAFPDTTIRVYLSCTEERSQIEMEAIDGKIKLR